MDYQPQTVPQTPVAPAPAVVRVVQSQSPPMRVTTSRAGRGMTAPHPFVIFKHLNLIGYFLVTNLYRFHTKAKLCMPRPQAM